VLGNLTKKNLAFCAYKQHIRPSLGLQSL